ncbi:tetratricopeptide repeat protein [Desulfovibrio sp. JC010]|uniref:tetratricopeptide repeat protein n=1 Tax=Desulfovibrio sp. JC010 TaxID=2593641 RepID=UPI0013D87C64|nr:tetratricopeptide repeat protein [Desulfovibrio sp. JC010]NDV25126.1 sel1 repeat family protein [Desulfovibrio sp. JC010]
MLVSFVCCLVRGEGVFVLKLINRFLYTIQGLVIFLLFFVGVDEISYSVIALFFPLLGMLTDYCIFVSEIVDADRQKRNISTRLSFLIGKYKTSFRLFLKFDYEPSSLKKPRPIVSLVINVLCILILIGVALDFSYGKFVFYTRGGFYDFVSNYSAERDSLEEIALEGNIPAQLRLGYLCKEGLGGDVDYRKSAEWYAMAEKLGSAKAAYELGLLYRKGTGVLKNCSLSFSLFKEAAHKGYVQSMGVLSFYYYTGMCNVKDFGLAYKWAKIGASKGDIASKIMIADYFYRGIGIEKDVLKAKLIYNELDNLDVSYAQFEFAKKLLEEDAEKNKVEAIKLLQRASGNGDEDAEEFLSKLEIKEN